MSEITYEQVLEVYNSIKPSRTRWVRNRNKLRNEWKELFKVLEQASGRSGTLVSVYDPNWHTYGAKAGTVGVTNKKKAAPVVVKEEVVESKQTEESTPKKKSGKK